MAATTADLVQKFVELNKKKKDKEADLDTIKEELDKLEQELLPRFQNAGVQNMKVNGSTVYIERKIWGSAKDGNMPGLCLALKGIGLGDLVKESANGQTFSAWLRELEQQVSPIPLKPEELVEHLDEQLRPLVQVSEVFKLKAKKG